MDKTATGVSPAASSSQDPTTPGHEGDDEVSLQLTPTPTAKGKGKGRGRGKGPGPCPGKGKQKAAVKTEELGPKAEPDDTRALDLLPQAAYSPDAAPAGPMPSASMLATHLGHAGHMGFKPEHGFAGGEMEPFNESEHFDEHIQASQRQYHGLDDSYGI